MKRSLCKMPYYGSKEDFKTPLEPFSSAFFDPFFVY